MVKGFALFPSRNPCCCCWDSLLLLLLALRFHLQELETNKKGKN